MKTSYFLYHLTLIAVSFIFLASPKNLTAQTIITENFDAVTGGYPTTVLPRGWSQGKYGVSSNPINQWDLLNGSSTTNPVVTPPSASNCLRFQSFAIPATEATFVASKRLDMRAIPVGGAALSFKLYRNDQYPANADRIQVYVNDSASVTPGSPSQLLLTETGSGLTAINRSITLAPTVASNGWYTYNYIITNTYNTSNVYVIIVGISEFGDNMYIDDFSVTTYPNAQNYVASSANIFTQNSSTTQAGAVNQEIIGIKVTMDGLATPRTMTEFIINTNGTTKPSTDLLNAKLYWSGGTPVLNLQNSILLGTSNNPTVTNDTFLVANPASCCLVGPTSLNTLDHGDNYFWVAYDLKPGATSGNVVDAEFVSVRITPNASPITGVTSSLPGNRLINVGYCQPTYSVGTSWAGYQTNDYIHGVTLVGNNSPVGGINMTNDVNTVYSAAGPLCGGTAYPRRCPFQSHPPDYEFFKYPGPALSNSAGPLPILNSTTTGLLCDANTNYPITLQVGTYGSGNAIAAWIDYNNDGVFNNYFDNIDKLCTGGAGANTLTLTNISYQNGQHKNYGLEVGMTVYGAGIAAGATVTALTATTVTLSAANTGAVSGVITFKNEGAGKDRGEKVAQSGPLQSLQTLSTSFRVPTWAGSFAGKRRLRVREVWINYNIHPCNPATYGETEDYEVLTIPDCSQYPGYKTWLGLTDEWENPVNWCPQGAPISGSTQNNPCNLRFPGGPPSGSFYTYSKARIRSGVQARACKMWIATGDTVYVEAPSGSDLQITDSLIIQSATSALILNTKKNDTVQVSIGTLRINNDQFLRPTQKNRSKWMYTYEEMFNNGLRAGDTIRTIRINLNARNSNGNPYKNFKIKYYFAASNSNLSTTPEPAVVASFNGFTYPAAPITVFSGDVNVSAIPSGQPGVVAFTLSPGIVIPPGWSGSQCTGLIPAASCALKMVIDMSYDHSGALPLTGDPYNSASTTEDVRSTQTGNTAHFHTFSTSSAGIVASAETMLAASPINTVTQTGATWTAGNANVTVGALAAGLSVGMIATSPAALSGRYITNIAGTTITLNTAPTAGGTNLSAIFAHRNPLSASIYRPNLTFDFKRPYIKYPITFSGPSWTNNGTFMADSSIVTFNGAAGQKIEGTSSTNFYDLTVSSPGHVLLNADISTADTLRFTSGRLKLNGRMLRHFNSKIGSIISTATSRIQPERDVIGTEVAPFSRFRWNMGTITGPRVLPFSNPAGANVDLTYDKITVSGDTAVTFITYSTLTTNANFPSPTVTNVNSVYWSGGTGVVDRFWSIQPTDSANARANLTFRYAPTENITTATTPINMQRWLYQPQFNVGCVTAGSTVQIVSSGTTNFTLIGAPDNNVGTVFTATGPGTGTGTITLLTATGGWEASSSTCGGSFPVSGQAYTVGTPHSIQLNNYIGFNTSPWWTAVGVPQPLSENAPQTVFIFGDFNACQGDSATLTASGGFASYLWNTGATSQTISPTTGGVYTVTATTSNGVTSTASQSVVINANPAPAISGNTTICQNSTTILSATVGLSNYSWNTGATSVSITVAPGATSSYTVTVTDNNGCTGSANTTVVVNPRPTPTITGVFNPCSGSAATLTANAGFNSYSWSTGATNQTINPTSAGTYTVTVTNNNGCTGSASQVVTIASNPTPSITGTFNVCQGFPATLTASTGFNTYSWSTGATTQTINPTTAGTYTVTVTDAGGCSGSVSQNVSINALPTPSIGGNFSICQGATSTLTASSGFNSYLWSTGATTASINTTTAGTFTVTVTDGNGCTGSTSQSVVVNANPTTTITGTFNVCQGSAATLTAGAGFNTYLWNTGATTQTINPTTAGTYTVTVTNTNGCTGSASQAVTITSNPVPSITGTFTVCQGNAATLTATAGYISYLWNTGATTQTINPTTAGTYTVTVTATGGCTGSKSQAVTVNANPTPSITGTTTICQNVSTTLTATAGFSSYSWNTGATTAAITVTPSASTTYTVTVTNSNGCTGSSSTSVTVNARPVPTISGTFAVCSGAAATLTANATGATSYAWSNGATTQTINPTTAATYTVTVTNSFGCTGTASQAVTVNTNPTASITGSFSVCQGNNATLTATAGFASYLWSTGATTQTINPNTAGTYTVTVTNANGCTGSASQAVTVNANPTPSITGTTTICQNVSTTLTATAGFSSYSWNTGATTAAITVAPSASTTYTVTVTNSNGCTGSASTSVTVNARPVPTISGTFAVCSGAAATLTANATGATSYAWSNGATTQTINPTTAATYTVTVTNSFGCTGTASQAVTVNTNPTASITGTFSVCQGSNATLTAAAGFSSYLWSIGATTQTINPNTAGTYTVTVTNANGCTGTASQAVTVNANPTPTITGNTTVCQGSTTAWSATAGFSSYAWNTGATTASINVGAAGTYTVTVTDANGCSGAASKSLSVNPTSTSSVTVNRCPGTSYTLPNGTVVSVAGTYNTPLTNYLGCDSIVTTILTFNDNAAPVASGCPAAFTTCNPVTWTPPTFTDNCSFSVSSNFSPGVNLPLGNTTVTYTATDAGGNSTLCSFIVTVVDFTLSTSQNNVTCFGQSNGSATVTATGTSGAVSYLWSNGATGATNINLAAGTYTVTVTNGNCSKQASVTITQPAQFTASITPSGATTFCQGGSVTLTATAATSYLWSTGATSQSIVANSSGNYFATVTNASGCTSVTAPVTITVNPNVAASVSIASSATGTVTPTTSITFTATAINGGSTPSFQWKKNNVNVGTNSSTYTNNAWTNLDVVTCVMTSNALCVSGSPANSNAITVYVSTGGGGGTSTPKFVVSDVTANRAYYYDSTFTFIVSNPLSTTVLNGTTNASDIFMTATNGYVLDGTANSRVYRSTQAGSVSVASRTLRTNTGSGLNPTTGLILRGDTMYIVDKKGKAIYSYYLSQAFNGATTTLNAFAKKTLLTANSTAEALGFDNTYFYVLDNGSTKAIYRYPLMGTAAGVRSRPLRTNTGATMGGVQGLVVDGSTIWVTDLGTDRAYPYDKAALFTGSNTVTINALTVKNLNSGNLNATGISITNTSLLLRQENPQENNLQITAWPNPTAGEINISLEGIDANERFTLRAYDMTGRLVAFREEAGTDTDFSPAFDLTGIRPGIYAIVVEQGYRRKTVRVVVD